MAPLVEDESVRRLFATASEETTQAIATRFRQGIEAKEVPDVFPCEERSTMILNTSTGPVIRARMGTPRPEMLSDAAKAADLLLSV